MVAGSLSYCNREFFSLSTHHFAKSVKKFRVHVRVLIVLQFVTSDRDFMMWFI